MQRQYPMQELCEEAVCDLKCSLRSHKHKEASQAFYLMFDMLFFWYVHLFNPNDILQLLLYCESSSK